MRKVVTLLVYCSIFLYFSFSTSFAQELSIKEATESSDVKDREKRIEYQLPYPGLLPDSPLYFAKAIRDRIIDFLISDPLKKADFYLLQADKRLNAGVYLFNSAKQNEKKINLAISTISKGGNYFEKAITKAQEAKKQGMDIRDIGNRLYAASKKHKETIVQLQKNADSKVKESLASLLKRVNDFEKKANSLISK